MEKRFGEKNSEKKPGENLGVFVGNFGEKILEKSFGEKSGAQIFWEKLRSVEESLPIFFGEFRRAGKFRGGDFWAGEILGKFLGEIFEIFLRFPGKKLWGIL